MFSSQVPPTVGFFGKLWVFKAAVEAGKLTEEQAWEKWKAIKKGQASKNSKNVDYEAIGHKLKAAVKAGELTEEQAKAKWAAIKKKAG